MNLLLMIKFKKVDGDKIDTKTNQFSSHQKQSFGHLGADSVPDSLWLLSPHSPQSFHPQSLLRYLQPTLPPPSWNLREGGRYKETERQRENIDVRKNFHHLLFLYPPLSWIEHRT